VGVHPVSYKRLGDGPCDRPGCGLVEHDMRTPDCLAHELVVIDIALNQLCAHIDVLATTGRKVVQYANAKSFVKQPCDQVRPDEACPASDKDLHR
jgi:hypothetical protein